MLVAVTVRVAASSSVPTYSRPLEVIVVVEDWFSETVQVTPLLAYPVTTTVAESCRESPSLTLAVEGETATEVTAEVSVVNKMAFANGDALNVFHVWYQ